MRMQHPDTFDLHHVTALEETGGRAEKSTEVCPFSLGTKHLIYCLAPDSERKTLNRLAAAQLQSTAKAKVCSGLRVTRDLFGVIP